VKIAILQSGFLPIPPLRGGAGEKMRHQLGVELAARGHAVTHRSRLCDGLAEDENVAGVHPLHRPGFDRPRSAWRAHWQDLRWGLRARAALPAADIVITNSFCAPMLLSPDRGAIYVDVQRMPKGQVRFYRDAARPRTNSTAAAKAIVARGADPRRAHAYPSVGGACSSGARNPCQRSHRGAFPH